MAAFVVGRSSWGRIGLVVATAIMVQPGFAGSLTFELANEGDTPIRLYPGLRLAQLVVMATQAAARRAYDPRTSTYAFPTGPEYPRAAWQQKELDAIDHMHRALGNI
jgi:dCTP deaminase